MLRTDWEAPSDLLSVATVAGITLREQASVIGAVSRSTAAGTASRSFSFDHTPLHASEYRYRPGLTAVLQRGGSTWAIAPLPSMLMTSRKSLKRREKKRRNRPKVPSTSWNC